MGLRRMKADREGRGTWRREEGRVEEGTERRTTATKDI